MSYVEQVLGKDENVQYAAHVALIRYWANFVLGGFILIGALPVLTMGKDAMPTIMVPLIIATLLLAWPFVVRATTELVLTNRKVIAKFGVLRRNTVEINFRKIESIRVNQGIAGRIFNYGNVTVSGSGSTHAPIPAIANPLEFRRAFDTALQYFEDTEKAR